MFYYLLLDTFNSLHKKSKEYANSNSLAGYENAILKSKMAVHIDDEVRFHSNALVRKESFKISFKLFSEEFDRTCRSPIEQEIRLARHLPIVN